MNRFLSLLLVAFFAIPLFAQVAESDSIIKIASPADVIPAPQKVELKEGTYVVKGDQMSFYIKKADDVTLGKYLTDTGLSRADKERNADVRIKIGSKKVLGDEAFSMTINSKGVAIEASTETGAFYAMQTLLQMTRGCKVKELQYCTIDDSPRLPYRGLHFDVSRHFRSKEFMLKQIDAMALMKYNNMHLHLTDDAGWRLQIDAYPRLTEFAAWRPQRSWQEWWVTDGLPYCEQDAPGAYGGYYTKDDIREIIAYAAARHINVIPEIEMPGHSREVLTAYPELSCSGKPYSTSDFCIGKEETFKFLETVLTEVIDLFPSQYIHIGGDEASKKDWKECPLCKKRMEEEGLKDVDELQSYFIHRIEEFVNSKGRTMVGYDEIIQGGLAPNAVVMSWRGTEGGITAMNQGNDAIMIPGSHCYFDYTQDAPFKEPVSIGGFTPLEKVYSFEPMPDSISDEAAKHLIGVQACLWTEYVTEDDHCEYMYYPRAFAIAEVGWTQPEKKDYPDFRRRSLMLIDQLRAAGYNTFDLANEYGDRKESQQPLKHLGVGCKVIYNIPYSRQYPAGGDNALTDGICGGWTYGDNKWQGTMRDFDVTVDLGSVKPVRYVGATFLQSVGAWVYMPRKVDIYVSTDGENFTLAGTTWCDVPDTSADIRYKIYSTLCDTSARYVRLHATKYPKRGAWLFVDEIVIN